MWMLHKTWFNYNSRWVLFKANSKVGYKASLCHVLSLERLQWLGLHSLHRRRGPAELIVIFKIFTGPSKFILPSTSRFLRGQHKEVLPKEKIGHFFEGATFFLPLLIFSRKVWNKFGQRPFPIHSYSATFDWAHLPQSDGGIPHYRLINHHGVTRRYGIPVVPQW